MRGTWCGTETDTAYVARAATVMVSTVSTSAHRAGRTAPSPFHGPRRMSSRASARPGKAVSTPASIVPVMPAASAPERRPSAGRAAEAGRGPSTSTCPSHVPMRIEPASIALTSTDAGA